MTYGYLIASSGEEENRLYELGCDRILVEDESYTSDNRPQFDELISSLKYGDMLIVPNLANLSMDILESAPIIQKLYNSKIKVHILNVGIVDGTTSGKMIKDMLLTFAEYERKRREEKF